MIAAIATARNLDRIGYSRWSAPFDYAPPRRSGLSHEKRGRCQRGTTVGMATVRDTGHMTERETTEESSADAKELPASAKENLEILSSFKDGEEAQISGVHVVIERISRFFGSAAYFLFAVAFIAVWMIFNA